MRLRQSAFKSKVSNIMIATRHQDKGIWLCGLINSHNDDVSVPTSRTQHWRIVCAHKLRENTEERREVPL
jgi:hypothetical protein